MNNTLTTGTLILLCAVIIFVIVFMIIMLNFTKKKNTDEKDTSKSEKKEKNGVPYENIKKFFPFDDIKDNMIVECEGINYYLMSEAEKIAVEEGFIQFLNSLRFPIQIYVQSRTINLDDSIATYKERLSKYSEEFNKLLDTFQALDSQHAAEDKLLEVGYTLEKKEKIINYTTDLIENISYLTQNSNVLQKKYYIAISYYISELGLVNNFDPAEMVNIAYTELHNRAESIRGGIYACGIESHILNTSELTEVIYIAINRDDSDIFNIKKIVDSDFLALSSTAKNTTYKKQDLLKEEKRARELQEEKERQIRMEMDRQFNLEQQSASKSTIDSSTML